MTLLEQIKTKLNEARRGRAPEAELLALLYADCLLLAKGADGDRAITDDKVLGVVSKLRKSVEETRALAGSRPDVLARCDRELAVIDQFLPTRLTEAELEAIVRQQVDALEQPSPRDIGRVMAFLKANHGGRYDGRAASTIAKRLLSAARG